MCEREVGGLLAAGGFAVRELPLGASRPIVSETGLCYAERLRQLLPHTNAQLHTHRYTCWVRLCTGRLNRVLFVFFISFKKGGGVSVQIFY